MEGKNFGKIGAGMMGRGIPTQGNIDRILILLSIARTLLKGPPLKP